MVNGEDKADGGKMVNVFVAFRKGFSYGSSAVWAVLLTAAYMGIGAGVYHNLETKDCDNSTDSVSTCPWTVVDSIYFCTVTMSTVGYGDLSPTTPETKVFTILWIFIGIIFVFNAVASKVGRLIHPLVIRGRRLMEYLFPQTPVDLSGDGSVDFMKPRHWAIYYSKNLLPLVIIIIAAQLVCAAVFLAFEDWGYGDAVYHCLVTATTVGYGDMSITTNGGKMWATFHIIVSVSLIGSLLTTVDELRDERRALLAKVKQLSRQLDSQLLDDLMKTAKDLRPNMVRDGKGLTELEFVLGMLIELEVVEWGKVRPFIKKFRTFDMNGNGRLGQEDLDMMVRGEARTEPTMDLHERSLSFTVHNSKRVAPAPVPEEGQHSRTDED